MGKSLVGTNLTSKFAVVTILSLALRGVPLAQAVSVIGVIFLPGAFLSRKIISQMSQITTRFVIMVACGFINFIIVGALVGYLLPWIGISQPLRGAPVEIVWVTEILFVVWRSKKLQFDPLQSIFSGMSRRNLLWIMILAIPPLLALLGSLLLNRNGNSTLAVAAAVIAVGVSILAIALPSARRGPPRIAMLASSLLTAAWQLPFRGGWLAGWDVQHEWSVGQVAINHSTFPLPIGQGGIADPYRGMLSLTVWPAQVHALTGLNLRTILALAPSIFLVLCLIAVWCTVRSRVSERLATTICAIFVVGSEPLIRELPSVTRQCYALFFFGILLFAISSSGLKTSIARTLCVIAGIGIAVTHYSSAYLAAGGIAVGWLASFIYRVPKFQRVLSTPVALTVVMFTIAWGSLVAKTGSSLNQVWASIKRDGFRFLPSNGGFVTKWLSGASISQTVSGKALHVADLKLRLTQYSWMNVDPRALDQPVHNVRIPTSMGWGLLGSALKFVEILASEGIIGLAALSVVVLLIATRKNRTLAPITGLAFVAVVASFVSRLSQTVAVDFGPTRIQAQMFLVFAVTAAIAMSTRSHVTKSMHTNRMYKLASRSAVPILALVGLLMLLASTQLANLVEPKASLPASFSARGEQIQRIVKPADIVAARWIALAPHRSQTIQSDIFGQLALFDFGLASSIHVIPNIDPVIIDDRSWLFASQTNLDLHIARGGDNARIGVFQFPINYLRRTRNILFSSSTNAVFGSDPIFLLQPNQAPAP